MPDPIAANHYCLKPGIERKLDMLLKGKLAIYDNSFGTNCEEVLKTIYEWVKAEQTEVVIIDNLMALDFPIITAEENIRLAYRNLKKNAGSRTPGTDGKTIADLAKMSEPELIGFVQQKFNWYQPQSVRRKEIP